VVKCGIGKVFASMAASVMISHFKGITLVINLGVAGGIEKDLCQGDFAVAFSSIQHDYDLSPEGLPVGNVAGYTKREFASDTSAAQKMCRVLGDAKYAYKMGVIVSGDQFIACGKKTAWLKNEFNAIACDMETGAIAHVCDILGVPFLGVRAISDNADDGAALDFNAFCTEAAKRSIYAVSEFLKSV